MENRRCSRSKNHITKLSRKSRPNNKRLRKQRNTRKTRYIRKYKHNSRKNKKGGNPKDDANQLMDMLHQNVIHTLSGGKHKDKPHDPSKINEGFKKLIGKPGTVDATKKENAFYYALENKKAHMNDEERKQMWSEAIIHQELPDGLYFNQVNPCKHGAKCIRENPVHRFMYHECETSGYPPITCAPTVVANYMYDHIKDN